MTKHFHIINTPEDWENHFSQHLPDKLQALSATSSIPQERDLEQSAQRFRPSRALLNAMNAAFAARVPLLLTGEPGTGKTQVAWYIKCFFQIPLFEYQVHSNSQASDMRYDFDAVAYLRDAYLANQATSDKSASDKPPDPNNANDPRSDSRYLKPAALWKAYECASECVLLIDEIDKAPRDFPNDLLQELDQNRFAHPFGQKDVERQGSPPITIITSNGERRLPDAFLRRCLVHHIAMTPALLQEIMSAWESQFPDLETSAREQALQRFLDIQSIASLSKKPGAAELLLWLSVLSAQRISVDALADNVPRNQLPALLCLIKDHSDYVHLD